LARLLLDEGKDVRVFYVQLGTHKSEDFKTNEKRLSESNVTLNQIVDHTDFPKISDNTIIIDALFGTGLNRPADGISKELIAYVNQSPKYCLCSVDIASGLFLEDNSENEVEGIIKADFTITFQLPKLAFLFPENEIYVGKWSVVGIGLSQEGIYQQKSQNYFVTSKSVQTIRQPRSKFGHKGSYGHALLVVGSKGMIGAAVLATKACIKSGCGLTSVWAPSRAEQIIQSQAPEALFLADTHTDFITSLPKAFPYKVIGVGPGIGQETQTANTLKLLIQNAAIPMVIDADALNILAENPTWLAFLPKGSILTPHPGEFARLTKKTMNSYERLKLQQAFSRKYQVHIILKGAYTSISAPDGKLFFNSSGNPGMATGGSGDVLTGLLTGIIASGYKTLEACILAVYVHGKSGDLALTNESVESISAASLIANLGKAFQHTE
jgi:NAD(P)H-hydrate epimerase